MGDFLNRLPIDVVFDISMLCETYSDFSNISAVVNKLSSMDDKAQQKLVTKIAYSPFRMFYKTELDGNLHSVNDAPAYVNDGIDLKVWYKHGKRHREGDLPAYIRGQDELYYRDGEMYTPIRLIPSKIRKICDTRFVLSVVSCIACIYQFW